MDGQVACIGETSGADGTAVSTAERARPEYRLEAIEDVACVRIVVIDWGQDKGHDAPF